MRVLVCGGRDFTNEQLLFETLNAQHLRKPISAVIHGFARGADTLGWGWAMFNNVHVEGFHADWNTHGKAAGPIRNQTMLDQGKPDLVIAFQGGRGTLDMCRRARLAGVEVITIGWDDGRVD